MTCPFTNFNLLAENINFDVWQRMIINSTTINKKKLLHFLCETKEEYIKKIIDNKDKPEILKEIFDLYKENKKIESERIEKEEEERNLKLFLDSIYHVQSDKEPKILIRLLSELDKENAFDLYKYYKIYAGEYDDDEEIEGYIDDFILKNLIYGILENDILVGCVIIYSRKKFKIDNEDDIVNTFYIQEIFISNDKKGLKYGEHLFNYIIKKCPDNIEYISFMTKDENKAMKKIAAKNNFEKQKNNESGDAKNPLLYIKKNDNFK